jgi:hypothetical protein
LLRSDEGLERMEGAMTGGVKQCTVERIEGEIEEEKANLSGAIIGTVPRTLRRFLHPSKMHIYTYIK